MAVAHHPAALVVVVEFGGSASQSDRQEADEMHFKGKRPLFFPFLPERIENLINRYC
jgi:hypothetical protein